MISFLLGLAGACFWAFEHGNAVYAEFMSGCEQDHKHYECMLLWRAGRSDDPLVVPTPVFVPSTR